MKTETKKVNIYTSTPWYVACEKEISDHILSADSLGAILRLEGENKEANAKFIVTACNAHDDLVKALENALRIEILISELSENYCRLNETGSKRTVESVQTSKANVNRINLELSAIRLQIKEALAKAGITV